MTSQTRVSSHPHWSRVKHFTKMWKIISPVPGLKLMTSQTRVSSHPHWSRVKHFTKMWKINSPVPGLKLMISQTGVSSHAHHIPFKSFEWKNRHKLLSENNNKNFSPISNIRHLLNFTTQFSSCADPFRIEQVLNLSNERPKTALSPAPIKKHKRIFFLRIGRR